MNLPAMWKTWVWSLGWEDHLEKEDGYPLLYSGLENSMDCSPWGHKELDMTERLLLHFTSLPYFLFLLHFLFIFFILLLSMSYLSTLSLSQIWPNKVLKHYICCTSLKKIFRRDFYIWVKLAKQLYLSKEEKLGFLNVTLMLFGFLHHQYYLIEIINKWYK